MTIKKKRRTTKPKQTKPQDMGKLGGIAQGPIILPAIPTTVVAARTPLPEKAAPYTVPSWATAGAKYANIAAEKLYEEFLAWPVQKHSNITQLWDKSKLSDSKQCIEPPAEKDPWANLIARLKHLADDQTISRYRAATRQGSDSLIVELTNLVAVASELRQPELELYAESVKEREAEAREELRIAAHVERLIAKRTEDERRARDYDKFLEDVVAKQPSK